MGIGGEAVGSRVVVKVEGLSGIGNGVGDDVGMMATLCTPVMSTQRLRDIPIRDLAANICNNNHTRVSFRLA